MRYVGEHGTYSFRVVASGRGLRYQWWNQEIDADDGHAIPPSLPFGVNSTRLRVTDAQNTRDYNGWYWCVVTDANGETAVTPRGQCVVVPPPKFIQQPRSQSIPAGNPVSFSVSVDANAPVPVKYQWLFNSRPIYGATGPTLSFGRVTPRKQGLYVCRAKTIGGTNFSAGAYLTVTGGN